MAKISAEELRKLEANRQQLTAVDKAIQRRIADADKLRPTDPGNSWDRPLPRT